MKKLFIILSCAIAFFACSSSGIETSDYCQYVDPTIGSVGFILEPTRPTVHLPNSMVRVYPLRADQVDDQIRNIPLLNTSHRLACVFGLLPMSGKVTPEIWNRWLVNDHEVTTSYYYSTELGDEGDVIEYSPEKKSGYFKIHFVGDKEHYLRLSVLNGNGEITQDDKRQFSGMEHFGGMKAYFYAETDVDIDNLIYQSDENKQIALLGVENGNKTLSFRYGVSYISVEQAKQNLEKEIPAWDFDIIKNNARKIWESALSKIRVEGGTEAQKRVFYTAFYRCYERMVDINEYGRYYSNYDKQVHESDKPFYVDNWTWDTHIALEPLHTILNPEQETYRINSYIDMYRQSGWMPQFALVNGEWAAMTGNFTAAWITDAWFKGLRDFDLKTAYEGLRKNSLEATLIPWRNGPRTPLDDFYIEHGYMPGLYPGEKETIPEVDTVMDKRQSVAVTTANSYSDWCIAQLASELGYAQDKALFLKKAGNYKNVYRADKGFVWPKDKDGNWIEPYDPRFAARDHFTETNAYTFNWDVKHDLTGLFELMGGHEAAEAKLDQLFREYLGLPKWKFWATQPDASGLVGQFVMGNEPSFHIPYIYNYLGAPWKTQKRVRMLLETFFTDNLFGIPGDEDGGGMSAFVVLSMSGFFPVTPGIPAYNIGSPVFDKITIDLPNGKEFVITAKNTSRENKYIQSASLNGKPLNRPWFTHEDLANGGKLELVMSATPNKLWGSGVNDAPPSKMEYR
jgi:predicted alpha-1,2-mannosidase